MARRGCNGRRASRVRNNNMNEVNLDPWPLTLALFRNQRLYGVSTRR